MQSSGDNIVWDQPQFLKRVRSKRDRALKLLAAFEAQIPTNIDELIAAAKANNFAQCAALAHMVKGVTANLGAMQLTSHLEDIEVVCGQSDQNKLSTLTAQTPGHLDKLNAELKIYAEADE